MTDRIFEIAETASRLTLDKRERSHDTISINRIK